MAAAHLPNETVSRCEDGIYTEETVADGAGIVTLQGTPTVAVAGYKYEGTMSSMKIEAGARIGSAQVLMTRIDRISLKLFRTLSGKFGSSEVKW